MPRQPDALTPPTALRAPWPCVCGHEGWVHDFAFSHSGVKGWSHCTADPPGHCNRFEPPEVAERKRRAAEALTAVPSADTLTLTVVTRPTAKARPRAVIRDGKVHVYTPEATATAETFLRWAWAAQHGRRGLEMWPPPTPLRLEVTFVLARPKSAPKDREFPAIRPDLDNFLKNLLDGLNGTAFHDDAQVTTVLARKRYARKGVAPHITITLEEDTEEE